MTDKIQSGVLAQTEKETVWFDECARQAGRAFHYWEALGAIKQRLAGPADAQLYDIRQLVEAAMAAPPPAAPVETMARNRDPIYAPDGKTWYQTALDEASKRGENEVRIHELEVELEAVERSLESVSRSSAGNEDARPVWQQLQLGLLLGMLSDWRNADHEDSIRLGRSDVIALIEGFKARPLAQPPQSAVIGDDELAGWARNWHWNDCADDKPVDPSIYFRDMRMLKAFIEKHRQRLMNDPPQRAWTCAARKQGTLGGNAPADCDWPGCGCDPAANKVLEAIDEAGFEITKKPEPTPWDANHNRSYEPVETLAKEIYDGFVYDGPAGTKKPTWTPGGNGTKQDDARFEARRRLRDAGHTSAVTRPESR